ncbi:MAG: TadE/TadG family type IV pilus assembly protein [Candidatus Sulfotelmatobacter sp.]
MRNAWRRLTRDTRGAEIAETAVVLPLLFVVVIAIFWFGQAFFIYGTVTHAARQGARAAVAPACATCALTTPTQNAVNAVNNALIAAKLNPAQVQAPSPIPILCGCGTASSSCSTPTVACDGSVPSSNVCVQPNVQLSYPSVLNGAGTCGTSVSFTYKYPFHFTLPCWPQPCTSLDLQKTALPARAQMRAETQ